MFGQAKKSHLGLHSSVSPFLRAGGVSAIKGKTEPANTLKLDKPTRPTLAVTCAKPGGPAFQPMPTLVTMVTWAAIPTAQAFLRLQ